MRKNIAIATMIIFSMAVLQFQSFDLDASEVNGSNDHSPGGTLTSYDPIILNNETDLEDLIDDEGWDGNGTVLNPYMIKDIEIDAEGSTFGLFIGNVSSHIIFRNGHLYNTSRLYYTDYCLYLLNSSNITIRNISFEEGDFGIYMNNVKDIEVLECNFSTVDGISALTFSNHDISIDGCFFENEDDGIYMDNVKRFDINNCTFLSHDGLIIYDSQYVEVSNCVFNKCYRSIRVDGNDDLTINGVTFIDNEYHSITISDTDDLIIKNASFSGTEYDDIYLDDIDGLIIENVTSGKNGYSDGGIYCNEVKNGFFRLIEMPGANRGLRLRLSSHLQFWNVNISSSYDQPTVYIDRTEECDFFSSKIHSEKEIAVSIENSNELRFVNCSFESESSEAMSLYQSIQNIFIDSEFRSLPSIWTINSDKRSYFNSYYNNRLIGDGFHLEIGSYYADYRDYLGIIEQTIPTNNTLNGKPIQYFNGKDLEHGPIPEGSQYFFVNCTNITLEDWFFNNESGLPMIKCKNIILKNVEIAGSGDGNNGLHAWDCDDLTITGSSAHNNSENGHYIIRSRNVTIRDCEFKNNEYDDLFLYHNVNTTIENNKFSRNIELDYCQGLQILDNKIGVTRFVRPFDVYHCDNIVIEGNEIFEGDWAFYLRYCSDVMIRENTIHNTESGVYTRSSSDLTVEDQIFEDLSYGIYSYRDDNLTIKDSAMIECGIGIYVDDSSDLNLYGNNFTECSIGLSFSRCSNGVITNNIVTKCEGHAIESSSTNRNLNIFWNAFINNNGAKGGSYDPETAQIKEDSNLNVYVTGQKGNHYGEYTTPDRDFDGIVDHRYLFHGIGISDKYPLVRTPIPTFKTPEITSIEPGPQKVTLYWNEPEMIYGGAIKGYKLYISANRGAHLLAYTLDDMNGTIVPDLEDGAMYSFIVSAYNDLGEGLLSLPVKGVPDSTAPIITIFKPEDREYIKRIDPYLSWKIKEMESDIVSTTISIDGSEPIDLNLNDTMISLEYLDEGHHMIKLTAVNSLGMTSTEEVRFTIDRTAPIIEFDQTGIIYSSSGIFDISWMAEDSLSGLVNEFHIEYSGRTDVITDTNFRCELAIDGEYSFIVSVIDLAGNEGTRPITLIKDSKIPILEIDIEDGIYFNRNMMETNWYADGTGSPMDFMDIRIDEGELSFILSSPYVKHLEEGPHLLHFRGMDMAGNLVEEKINIMVDTTKPFMQYIDPNGSDVELDADIEIIFSEEVLVDDITVNNIPISFDMDGNRLFIRSNVDWERSTTYKVEVLATDLAGNFLLKPDFSFSTIGQGIIMGRLIDNKGKPIENADVFIDTHSTRSDLDGRFSITGEEGLATLVVSKKGYERIEKQFILTNGEKNDIGNITLAKEDVEVRLSIIMIMVIATVILIIASIIGVITIRKKKGLDHSDYNTMKEIMSGFGISRSPKGINCYDILEVKKNAREPEIKKAYRSLASRYHPDRNLHSNKVLDHEEKMREINAAKSILLDPEKKEVHDRMLNHFGDR